MTQHDAPRGRLERRSGAARRTTRSGIVLRLVAALIVLTGGGWLIATQQLPYVLADGATDLALQLNPAHPAPLLQRADRLRARLLALADATAATERAAEPGQTSQTVETGEAVQTGQTGAPERAQSPDTLVGPDTAKATTDTAAEIASVRRQLRDVARRILVAEPFNAKAYRLLGELSTDIAETRKYMRKAVSLSRRESVAVFWLMHDAHQQERPEDVMRHAHTLMRTEPRLNRYTIGYLAQMAANTEQRRVLISALAKSPPWRQRVLKELPRQLGDPGLIRSVMTALGRAPGGLSSSEASAFISTLARLGRIDLAYAGWLGTLDEDRLNDMGFINNPGFEFDIGATIFDWRMARPANALHAIERPPGTTGLAFHVILGPGRVTFPKLSQTLVLGPGTYELSYKIKGQVIGKRGLYWSLRCLKGGAFAKSDPMTGTYRRWTSLSLRVEVPAREDCGGQILQLTHGARSASEQLVSGDLWIDDVVLKRLGSGSRATSDLTESLSRF